MASIILLAGNRRAEIDRAHAENSYHQVQEIHDISVELKTMTTAIHEITLAQADLMVDIHTLANHLGAELKTPAPD